jgi:hypothetical protein
MTDLSGFDLPFRFNPERLQADLAHILAEEWSPHYNERDFGGKWRGAALRSANGSSHDLIAGASGPFVDTPLLARCPYFREVLATFQCPLKSVRLLSLAAGSFIREHSDKALQYEDGEVRIHVPIVTGTGVEFYVSGERLLLEAGGCYYVNVHLPHRVNNRGTADRVHLIIDAEVNGWVDQQFRDCRDRRRYIPRCPLPPLGFEGFRKIVFEDEAPQRLLRDIPGRAEFIEEVVRLGQSAGFDFHEADVDAGFRMEPASNVTAPVSWQDWIPTRVRFPNGKPVAEMVWAGGREFKEPFFADSVQNCLRNPFAALFRRARQYRGDSLWDGPSPRGFIFHVSRCGSTLLSRMLAAPRRALVISEAAPLDDIIHASLHIPGLTRAEHISWLRWVVGMLGTHGNHPDRDYFVKLDAWHIHQLALIRAAFPDTPWIFLYRDPLEVMVSHQRQPGLHAAPGALDPRIFGLSRQDAIGLSPLDWSAAVLAGFFHAALAARDDPRAMFVDYARLPEAVFGPIARHLGSTLEQDDHALMREAATMDAKNPFWTFESDTAEKREHGEALRNHPGIRKLDELYRELADSTRPPA